MADFKMGTGNLMFNLQMYYSTRFAWYLPQKHDFRVYSYILFVGFWFVEMAISTNPKPTIYRNLYENTIPVTFSQIGYINPVFNNKRTNGSLI